MVIQKKEEKDQKQEAPPQNSEVQELVADGSLEELANPEQKEIPADIQDNLQKNQSESAPLSDGPALKPQPLIDDAKKLKDDEKIGYLLKIAQSKGVVFAVQEAKKMNDPYIVDKLHDELAKDGQYKKFLK